MPESPVIGVLLGAGGGACVGNFDTLADLQRGVHGWIEAFDVAIPPNDNGPSYEGKVTMYCNEESKISGKPANDTATALFRTTFYPPEYDGPMDYISGDVVLVGLPDDEGNSTSLPPEACNALFARLESTR